MCLCLSDVFGFYWPLVFGMRDALASVIDLFCGLLFDPSQMFCLRLIGMRSADFSIRMA